MAPSDREVRRRQFLLKQYLRRFEPTGGGAYAQHEGRPPAKPRSQRDTTLIPVPTLSHFKIPSRQQLMHESDVPALLRVSSWPLLEHPPGNIPETSQQQRR